MVVKLIQSSCSGLTQDKITRRKLDDFEQRYLEAVKELGECKGYEIRSSTKLERWQNAIEEIGNRIALLGDPL